jgi:hypothetical protein
MRVSRGVVSDQIGVANRKDIDDETNKLPLWQ